MARTSAFEGLHGRTRIWATFATGMISADMSDARRRIDGFVAEVKDRLHSALGYQSPLEFETAFAQNKAR